MTKPFPPITDHEVELVLRGVAADDRCDARLAVPPRPDLAELAGLLADFRAEFPPDAPRASAPLAELLGLPTSLPMPPAHAVSRVFGVSGGSRGHRPGRQLFAWVTGVGLGMQVALGGTAAATVGGVAGLAGVLPPDMQQLFDDALGRGQVVSPVRPPAPGEDGTRAEDAAPDEGQRRLGAEEAPPQERDEGRARRSRGVAAAPPGEREVLDDAVVGAGVGVGVGEPAGDRVVERRQDRRDDDSADRATDDEPDDGPDDEPDDGPDDDVHHEDEVTEDIDDDVHDDDEGAEEPWDPDDAEDSDDGESGEDSDSSEGGTPSDVESDASSF